MIRLPVQDDFEAPPWLDVSRETSDSLVQFVELVAKWSPKINLVSRSDLSTIWQRHVLDSAQIIRLAPKNARLWVDLGSGGGFPGVVAAIILRQNIHVTLVESDARKCAFLQTVATELSLDVRIENCRIESLPPMRADIVSARALAPLPKLLGHAFPLLGPNGVCLFMKGARVDEELTMTLESWQMNVEKIPSVTESTGTILKIGDLSRV